MTLFNNIVYPILAMSGILIVLAVGSLFLINHLEIKYLDETDDIGPDD